MVACNLLSVYIRSDACKHIFLEVRFLLKEHLQSVEILQCLSGLFLTLSASEIMLSVNLPVD